MGICVQLAQSADSDPVRSRVPLLNSRFASHQLVTANRLTEWKQQVQAGATPEFGGNLLY